LQRQASRLSLRIEHPDRERKNLMSVHRSLGNRLGLPAVLVVALAGTARAGDLDKYLPADSEVVVNVNVRQLLDAPLVKMHALDLAREALKGVDMAEDILNDLGFDPFKDLDRIIAASPGGTDRDRGLLIAHGKFDRAKFKAKAEDVIKTYGDVMKIRKVPDGTGGHYLVYEVNHPEAPMPFFVALPEDNTFLAAPGKDYVVDALKKIGKTEKPALKDKELQALLEKVDARQTVSVAAVGTALKGLLADQAPAEAIAVLDKLTAIGGGLTLGEDIKLEVVASTKDAADARDFRDGAERNLNLALLALAALSQGEKNPGIELALDVVKSLKVKAKDRIIVLKGRVSADDIEEALKQDK
jgi:hypothetical protein